MRSAGDMEAHDKWAALVREVNQKLADTPARSMMGVAVKLQYASELVPEVTDQTDEQTLLSARNDAARLAGLEVAEVPHARVLAPIANDRHALARQASPPTGPARKAGLSFWDLIQGGQTIRELHLLRLCCRQPHRLPARLWKTRNVLSVVPLCGPVLTQHALNVGVLTLNALVIGRF